MSHWYLIVLGILGLSWQISCREGNNTNSKYDNYTLLRLYPTNEVQLEAVRKFQDSEGQVELMKVSRGLNDSLDILVPPERLVYVDEFAKTNNLRLEAKPNYGMSLEIGGRVPRRRAFREFIYQYNSFSSIQKYLESVAERYSDIVELETLGTSYEGREMKLVKISSNRQARNPIIFVDAGIHAREWAAPSMAVYLIYRLTIDPDARRKDLNGVDWYILPVVNPDGYEYTRREDRMWRKTRSKHDSCYGVDGNRNYGFKWAVSGVSMNPCDKETYAGPEPFSEPETRMVKKVMMDNADRLKLYVSLHAYGQYLVYPWGYTGAYLPERWKRLDSLAKAVSNAVERAGGKPFKVLSAGKWYPAAGGSDDYAFGAVGVPYSYTMELTDGYEFVFPEDKLRTVLPQFYIGFKAFGEQIRREFSNKRYKRDLP